jgi:cytochrome c1
MNLKNMDKWMTLTEFNDKIEKVLQNPVVEVAKVIRVGWQRGKEAGGKPGSFEDGYFDGLSDSMQEDILAYMTVVEEFFDSREEK